MLGVGRLVFAPLVAEPGRASGDKGKAEPHAFFQICSFTTPVPASEEAFT